MIYQRVTITLSIGPVNQLISIHEATEEPDFFDPREMIKSHVMRVVNLRDQAVRAALIKLGWRPPVA